MSPTTEKRVMASQGFYRNGSDYSNSRYPPSSTNWFTPLECVILVGQPNDLSAVFSLYNQSCGPQHVPTYNADTLEAMWADLSDVL